MSVNIHKFSVLNWSNGWALWRYAAPAEISAVVRPGYFNEACDMLSVADRITVTGPAGAIDLHVATIAGSSVTVVPMQATPLAINPAIASAPEAIAA